MSVLFRSIAHASNASGFLLANRTGGDCSDCSYGFLFYFSKSALSSIVRKRCATNVGVSTSTRRHRRCPPSTVQGSLSIETSTNAGAIKRPTVLHSWGWQLGWCLMLLLLLAQLLLLLLELAIALQELLLLFERQLSRLDSPCLLLLLCLDKSGPAASSKEVLGLLLLLLD
ncbi:hypothetical protein BKA57DRAFT_462945 [Linnemannia elongata]|nr:hypothetical protein BKA57DRAFT_462945 [Linnemannia elongata]